MRQTTIEPGVLQALKTLAVLQVVGVVATRSPIATAMGIEMAREAWLEVALAVPLFLVAFTWIPWWHRMLGRIYVPLILAIASINIIVEKYLTLSWFTQPADQEVQLILLVVKLWLNMLLIMVVVAWQFSARWTLFTCLAISAADVILSLPFMKPGNPFFPFTIFLFFARLFTVTFVALLVQWLVNRQREQRLALAEANRKLAHYAATNEQLAVSHERIRLAQELHDTLAHSLSSVTVQLEAAEAIWDVDGAKAHALVQGALENTRGGVTEARRALQALRAGALEEVGLRVAVGNLAHSTAARANLNLNLNLPDELPTLTQAEEQCVYRVAQEALSNVARHARATHVRVELGSADGQLLLTVADNGRGFDPARVNGGHFGLKGLNERADLAGGTLDIRSEPTHGTTLILSMPITEAGS
jgi:signal transduction histidine kinase